MHIRITFKKISYSIAFGDSAVCQCSYWFSITKEYYEGMKVTYATWVCGLFRKKGSKGLFLNKP